MYKQNFMKKLKKKKGMPEIVQTIKLIELIMFTTSTDQPKNWINYLHVASDPLHWIIEQNIQGSHKSAYKRNDWCSAQSMEVHEIKAQVEF